MEPGQECVDKHKLKLLPTDLAENLLSPSPVPLRVALTFSRGESAAAVSSCSKPGLELLGRGSVRCEHATVNYVKSSHARYRKAGAGA